jgi:hypothetical protein
MGKTHVHGNFHGKKGITSYSTTSHQNWNPGREGSFGTSPY